MSEATAAAWLKARGEFEEVPVLDAAKRCGVQWDPWMGDWFTSWSPRNGNSNAEGTWEHWIVLALQILQDPMTAIVWPDLAAIVAEHMPPAPERYDETERRLTAEELRSRFDQGGAE